MAKELPRGSWNDCDAIDDEKGEMPQVHLPLNVWGQCNQLVIFSESLMVELKAATGKAE